MAQEANAGAARNMPRVTLGREDCEYLLKWQGDYSGNSELTTANLNAGARELIARARKVWPYGAGEGARFGPFLPRDRPGTKTALKREIEALRERIAELERVGK